jgi:hypothetical protein
MKLDETYDCGCGPEPSSETEKERGDVHEDEKTGMTLMKGG